MRTDPAPHCVTRASRSPTLQLWLMWLWGLLTGFLCGAGLGYLWSQHYFVPQPPASPVHRKEAGPLLQQGQPLPPVLPAP